MMAFERPNDTWMNLTGSLRVSDRGVYDEEGGTLAHVDGRSSLICDGAPAHVALMCVRVRKCDPPAPAPYGMRCRPVYPPPSHGYVGVPLNVV